MKSYPRAFTLIELIITIAIVAILSVGLMVNFQTGILKARFDDEVTGLVHLLEQARSYSLTNFLINDTEPADYYLLTVSPTGLSLEAYGPSLESRLEELELDPNFSITDITGSELAFYFPSTGEICFETVDCSSGVNEISFTLVDSTATYSQTISVNKYGGAPELLR